MKTVIFSVVTLMNIAVFSTLSAHADATAPGLPGVKLPPAIVQAPPPEPDEKPDPSATPGSFRVGNTQVHISGDIRIDVGTGNARRPR